MHRYKLLWGLKYFLLFMALIAVAAWVVKGLWNWLIPDIFDGPTITFIQALGLFLLSKILLWGFRPGGWKHESRHWENKKARWKERFQEKWERMSEEEKDKMRAKFKGRCNWFEEPEPSKKEFMKEEEN